jgi:hypothetical protein
VIRPIPGAPFIGRFSSLSMSEMEAAKHNIAVLSGVTWKNKLKKK